MGVERVVGTLFPVGNGGLRRGLGLSMHTGKSTSQPAVSAFCPQKTSSKATGTTHHTPPTYHHPPPTSAHPKVTT